MARRRRRRLRVLLKLDCLTLPGIFDLLNGRRWQSRLSGNVGTTGSPHSATVVSGLGQCQAALSASTLLGIKFSAGRKTLKSILLDLKFTPFRMLGLRRQSSS